MTKFYTRIAEYYDDIFPTGQAQCQLITKVTGDPPKDILDVACGSGGYSKALSDSGYRVTAVDLDDKMVENLKKKDDKIDARVLNMLHIEQLPGKYDSIFCIGNSLVHLNNLGEIGVFLQACGNKLRAGGKLILQVINFDRILAKGITSLPTLYKEDKNLSFERYYRYIPEQHKIDFHTILTVNDQVLENHVLLFPIKSAELRGLLEESGFTNIQFYGNFTKEKFTEMESSPLVVVAEK